MVRYANGQAPLSKFVKVGDQQYLWPGTARRWKWMVAEGQRRHGVTLYISPGVNGYRWLSQQYETRDWACNVMGNCLIAALPGTSSHGGTWAGPATNWQTVDTGAIDVGNWGEMGWANFNRLARDAGFITNAVSPQELWHIIDLNPWVVPSGGDDTDLEDNELNAEEKKQLRELHRLLVDPKSLPNQGWGYRVLKNLFESNRAGRKGQWGDGSNTRLLKENLAEITAVKDKMGGATTRFYKHGDMPKGSSLWMFVYPNGDFVRIRGNETAALYKELNGGFQSKTISKEAMHAIRDDLLAGGGRDLSALAGSTEVRETTAEEAEGDDLVDEVVSEVVLAAADAPFQSDDEKAE